MFYSPKEKRRRRIHRFRFTLFLLGAFAIISLLDYPLLHLLYIRPEREVHNNDWYRMLRIMGYMGSWAVVGGVFILHDRSRHRGLAVIFAPLLSGGMAELLKLIVGRERPHISKGVIEPGLYHFRGFFAGFQDGHGLGFPSSHPAVAFGGCLMLACFLPRARTLLVLLALGCGITRMVSGAHFASDVFGGAMLGWAAATIMCRLASQYLPELRPRYRRPL